MEGQGEKLLPNPLLNQKGKAVFLTILAGVLWGTSFPIIKIGLSTIDPFAFVFWRFLVSSVTLVIVMLFLGKLQFNITNKRLLVLLGMANGAGYLLQYAAMGYTSVAKAALFINLSAMWVAILSPGLLNESFSRKKILGVLFGLAGIVFVSTNLDFSTLGEGQLIADLMLIVSGIFWALFMIYNKKLLVFLGIANGAGYLLQYAAMGYTSVAKAALFINLSAMWVAILSPILLSESFSRKKIVGVLFGLAGIVFVSTNLDFSTLGEGQLIADLMLIVSGVAWALFMIYNKKLITHSTSAMFQWMTWVLLFTLFTIAPFAGLAGQGFFALSGWAWAAIVYTAIVCWVIPYYLWLEGLKYLSASTSTILLLSEIVVAVFASVIVLKEPVTLFSTIGALFIIIAVALVSLKENGLGQKSDKSNAFLENA